MASKSSKYDPLALIPDATDDTDKTFKIDNMPYAVKKDRKKLEEQYKVYVEEMLPNDHPKPVIHRKKKIDMDAERLKMFLEEFKSDIPKEDPEVGDFPIFEMLEKCVTEGWQFGGKKVEEKEDPSRNNRCYLYYNVKLKQDAAKKFSVAIYYLVTGRANMNNHVFYAGLIEQKLVHKKQVSEDNYEFFLQWLFKRGEQNKTKFLKW